jgi:hypothetical protein
VRVRAYHTVCAGTRCSAGCWRLDLRAPVTDMDMAGPAQSCVRVCSRRVCWSGICSPRAAGLGRPVFVPRCAEWRERRAWPVGVVFIAFGR